MNTIEEELKAAIEGDTPAPAIALAETSMSLAETQILAAPETIGRAQREIKAELRNQASAPQNAVKCKVISFKKAKKTSKKEKSPKTFVETIHKIMGKPNTKISKSMIREMPSTDVRDNNNKVIVAFRGELQNEVVFSVKAKTCTEFMSMMPTKLLSVIDEMVFYDYINKRRWIVFDKNGLSSVENIQ